MGSADAPPHPRDIAVLDGLEAPSRAFLDSLEQGRLHHAWLLCGPEGSGKASFAYQAARRLLGARPDPAAGGLASATEDPVSRMVAARSHPDLIVLERASAEAPSRRNIPVDEARRLPEFFAKAPALAPYRVAIIDSADDLNGNAANAVLKTLEEPSGHGLLLLVSHAPGRLLATLRSRCRRLSFPPWSEAALASFIRQRLEIGEAEAVRLARMARGAPGQALALAASGALELDQQIGAILARLPRTDDVELLALSDGFKREEGAERFALVMGRLADRVHAAASALGMTAGGGAAADGWSRSWERVGALTSQVEALNLDRSDAFWSFMAELRQLSRRHPAPG